MAKKKGNKGALETVNKAMDIIKRIKAGEEFSQQDKMDILDDFVGVSDISNNSFWTPLEVCQFIKDLLPIDEALNEGKEIHIADLSAGIGMMCRPFLSNEYGKLVDGVKFDLYEYNPDTSMALTKAWSDFKQVKVIGDCDTLSYDIPDNTYDFILGNPPFSGSYSGYEAEWLLDGKKMAKSASIMDCFIDANIKACKENGFIAIVVGGGHLYKGQRTEKLRNWMRGQVALRAIIPLSQDTFAEAGINGTSIGSYLIVWQKGAKQEEVFLGDLQDKQDLKTEMKSMAKKFKLLNFGNYNITYESNNHIKHCKLNPKTIWTNTN